MCWSRVQYREVASTGNFYGVRPRAAKGPEPRRTVPGKSPIRVTRARPHRAGTASRVYGVDAELAREGTPKGDAARILMAFSDYESGLACVSTSL